MKRILLLLAAVLAASTIAASVSAADEAFDRWRADKYSMFIHFGLYSYYGGVWDGKPVTRGYSEQIQSHAGIYGDWYAEAAADFDPQAFDADAIVSLARKAGMRSIVFTSKHHDGFCMFETSSTDYNSVRMTPAGRDYVKELSDACAKAGMKFGLYFSLIDWNFPHAYPISSHNADPITPQHHQLNMLQVKELLSSYGEISELWFDMGSLTPQQSAQLYGLVKEIQPSCMVSGRLGNDMYDFAVMPDNFYPDSSLHAPWQCAASMFNETWSWRSWQERGEVSVKVAEKLRSLINVVSHGGNYLLNIGPRRDGSLEPFEVEVLERIGSWLKENSDAIYGVQPSPFDDEFSWGTVTVNDNRMFLILSGEAPSDGKIQLSLDGCRLKKVLTGEVNAAFRKGMLEVSVPQSFYEDDTDVKVVALEFDGNIGPQRISDTFPSGSMMTAAVAAKDYSYSCFDYYSNYRSTVAYSWDCMLSSSKGLAVFFPEEETGRKLNVGVSGQCMDIVLDGTRADLQMASYDIGESYYFRLRGGVFNGPSSWERYQPVISDGMKVMDAEVFDGKVTPFSNHLIVRDLEVSSRGLAVFEFCAGNGVEVILDGQTMLKHLNPYGTSERKEVVVLALEEGKHRLILRAYNRFEESLHAYIKPSQSSLMAMDVPVDKNVPKKCHIRISSSDGRSEHTDCGLHNLLLINK